MVDIKCRRGLVSSRVNALRKLVWLGNDDFTIEHLAGSPPDPGEDQVLLKVRSVGICGTDIHILKGALPTARPPMVLGHEISGEIAAAGKNVDHVREGDRVTVDAVVGCGNCELCRRSRIQFCADGFEFGISRDGGCQDYLVLPKENVYPIPNAISFEEAAMLDMEVYNAVRKCRIESGDSVLIQGAGPIGLIACQVTRVMGAGHVTLSDVIKSRLNVAQALGMADAYMATPENGASALAGHEPARPFDVVIDCAGTSSSIKQALKVVRPCGRVLLYGVYENAIDRLDLNLIVLKDLVLFGSQSDRTGWEDVIAMVSSGTLNLKSLITHRFALEDGPHAYDLVHRREPTAIKAVLLV
jgi:2-desacetyl-2-hydroxyethyl bacteriochlorophyllide A dehydrogenase